LDFSGVNADMPDKIQKTSQKNKLPDRQQQPGNVQRMEDKKPFEVQQAAPIDLGRVAADLHAARLPEVVALQHGLGNRAVTRLIKAQPAKVLQRQMEDEGKVDEAPVEGAPVVEEKKMADLEEAKVNEFGEQDGELTSDVQPHVFVNGGKTGVGIVGWVGGPGGKGNQNVGEIVLVAPQYESRAAANGNQAKAWVRAGTGTATVTRSYTGVVVGANGPTHYFTANASARADEHEVLHVESSRDLHKTHIVPLEARRGSRTGEANALFSGTTAAEAEQALKAFIKWNDTIDAFRDADKAANTPMGTVDIADLASPTFIKNYGPQKVNKVTYPNYLDTPPGPKKP
jgi:hypothetical protein